MQWACPGGKLLTLIVAVAHVRRHAMGSGHAVAAAAMVAAAFVLLSRGACHAMRAPPMKAHTLPSMLRHVRSVCEDGAAAPPALQR